MLDMDHEKDSAMSVKEAELLNSIIQHEHAIDTQELESSAHGLLKQAKRRRSSVTQFISGVFTKLQLRLKKGPEFKNFLSLPLEIREEIYSYLLTTDAPVTIDPTEDEPSAGLTPALLRTCRQVYEEAAPILYKHNHLVMTKPAKPLVDAGHVHLTRHLDISAVSQSLCTDKIANVSSSLAGVLAPTMQMRNMRALKLTVMAERTFPLSCLGEYLDMDNDEKSELWVDGEDTSLVEEAAKCWGKLHGGLRFQGLRFKADEMTGNVVRRDFFKIYVQYEMEWTGYRAKEVESKTDEELVQFNEKMLCQHLEEFSAKKASESVAILP
jgi:hypothetical protein